MRILIWHVHGSWTTSFVQGEHTYLLPVVEDRGPDGRGRARTWDWPAAAVEVTPERLADEQIDAVVLQRPHELDLVRAWTGRRPGSELPAVYLEHDTPRGPAAATRHPVADRDDIPLVHVTHFNRIMWDNGLAPTAVIEHGILDPGPLYTGTVPSAAVVVNEPVRRERIAGTDLLVDLARDLPVEVYGMQTQRLADVAEHLAGHLHERLSHDQLHPTLGRHRLYLHPYRWTSLGLALLEAMMIGMPVLGLPTTEAPRAVPPAAGLLSADLGELATRARLWLHDPGEAAAAGAAARDHALAHFGIDRFLTDWNRLLERLIP